jgi:hypothetical protein
MIFSAHRTAWGFEGRVHEVRRRAGWGRRLRHVTGRYPTPAEALRAARAWAREAAPVRNGPGSAAAKAKGE